jgi:endonuclease YncB( thermonuclease family)
MIFRLLVAVLAITAGIVQAKEPFFGVVTHIADGDTLWVQPDGRGRPRKLRIEGIDAPEICQPGGKTARSRLAHQVLNKRVEVTVKRRDVYGRGLAFVRVDGNDVGAHMVQSGFAWSYRWQSNAGPYASEESAARQSRLGIFGAGESEEPRMFRKRHGACLAGD